MFSKYVLGKTEIFGYIHSVKLLIMLFFCDTCKLLSLLKLVHCVYYQKMISIHLTMPNYYCVVNLKN